MLTPGHLMENSGSGPPKDSEWIRDLAIFGMVVAEVIAWTGAGLGLGYLMRIKLGAGEIPLVLTTVTGFAIAVVRISRFGRKSKMGRKEGETP